jgi:hypothetical protein
MATLHDLRLYPQTQLAHEQSLLSIGLPRSIANTKISK